MTKADPDRTTTGSALVVSLALLLLLMVLGTSVLTLSGLESKMSHNDLWAEGALQAAEAGVHLGIDQLDVDPVVSTQPIAELEISPVHTLRSGGRLAAGPQPLQFLGKDRRAGYTIAVGTGYNPSGFVFARYQINATGIGPRNTRREVEAATQFGPIPE